MQAVSAIRPAFPRAGLPYTILDADQSARVLASKIYAQEPFFYLRYGDGAIECMNGNQGRTCDGEYYSPDLGLELLSAWISALNGETVYIGDWLSAAFEGPHDETRYEKFYRKLIGAARPKWLHFEALLLMRESRALVDFYRAVKFDPRPKLYMGPAEHVLAAEMLGCDFLQVPMKDLFRQRQSLLEELLTRDFEVLLYGAGMAGNIPVVRCWERFPERTYVHLGSAMDPLFRGRTRQQQILPQHARKLFAELL